MIKKVRTDGPADLIRRIGNAFMAGSEPVSIVHFVTERCNARCSHCFVDFDNACTVGSELSLAEIRLLSSNMGSCLYNVNLTGGEPFLRDDLFAIAEAYLLNSSARSIIITTNGTQTEAVGRFLHKWKTASLHGRVKISISIDHLEEHHDKNRCISGAFRAALDTYRIVDEMKDAGIMPDIALTVTPYNAAEIIDIYENLKSRGLRYFSPILMREEGAVQKINNRAEIIAAYNALSLRIVSDSSKAGYPVRHRVWERIRNAKNAVVRDYVSGDVSAGRSGIGCSAGSLFGVIAANGDLLPCEMLGRESIIGNLREYGMDFMKIWKSGRTAHEVYQSAICRRCTYECALTVTVMTRPSCYPAMFGHLFRNV